MHSSRGAFASNDNAGLVDEGMGVISHNAIGAVYWDFTCCIPVSFGQTFAVDDLYNVANSRH